MAAQFRLTKPPIQDIEEIADLIAQQSGLERSEKFLRDLESKFSRITLFPQMGRERSEILSAMRSVPIDTFIIFYILLGQDIEILRVVSGYRDSQASFE